MLQAFSACSSAHCATASCACQGLWLLPFVPGFLVLVLRYLSGEEPLGQGGNEGDFDDQSNERFKGSKHRKGTVERDIVPWKEAPTVEAGHAKDKSTKRGEQRSSSVAEDVVRYGKPSNDEEISEKPATWSITITSTQKT